MRYNNYHKHTHKSSIYTPDTYIKTEDYCKRAIELGHDTYFTTEHGYGGDIFESREYCEKYGLKCVFACEGYIVKDANMKDSSNYHIMIIARTNKGRRKINKAISNANKYGFYYKPRFFLDEILKIEKEDVYLTTACIAGILRDDDSYEEIFIPLAEKFQDHMFLEVQSHNHERQVLLNKKIKEIKNDIGKKYGCKIISANDSHYIYEEDSKIRDLYLRGKKVNFPEEEGLILDYPDYKTLFNRYKKQGVFSDEEIKEAIENTLIFDDCEEIDIDKSSKMPNINKGLNREERFEKLKKIAYDEFEKIKIEDEIKEEDFERYYKKIDDCLKVVHDTMEMDTQDYFLLDYEIFKKAINEYGGVLTNSGRGSNGCFYLNRVLRLTQLDDFTTDIPMYPDRFMSTARTLENRSYPDIDANVMEQEPFIRASKDFLGEFGCYPMMTYGTMKDSESFRNTCRAHGLKFDEFNDVAKNIDSYREIPRWKRIIEESEKISNTIVSASIHPCSFLLFDGDIEEEIGVIRINNAICAIITSDESDNWKYLKNDYLIVSVLRIINDTCKLSNINVPTLLQLRKIIDEKTWDIYKNGMTCTVNQFDSDYATHLAMKYNPHSVEDVAKFVAAIRPSFDSWREHFMNREHYSNGVKEMDELFAPTDRYILFQENIMQYFEWLGVSPAKSIGLIKKISKKKIKEEDFKVLEKDIRKEWIKNTGTEKMFDETWEMIQSCMAYGFNTPHGLGYAYDSLYCAYLKSHYTLEYYTVVLNLYSKDEERTRKLIKEAKNFKINVKEPIFRHSLSEYIMDKETNTIYKGISSIKGLNSSCADSLYKLRNNKYNNFIDLLYDIKNLKIEKDKIETLIKLDFFREFGNANFLYRVYLMFLQFKNGDMKSIKKEKITNEILYNIIENHSRETAKQFNDIDMKSVFNDIYLFIKSQEVMDFTYKEKISFQMEYLGYISLCTDSNDEKERRKLIVTEVTPIKAKRGKNAGKVFAYGIKTQSIGSGKIGQFTVMSEVFYNEPIKKMDIIFAENVKKNGEYWHLLRYYHIL